MPAACSTLIAVALLGLVLAGMLVLKPVMRVLISSDADLNESIGCATAEFNLFYGLLPGLLTVSAYENNTQARQAVLGEANAISVLSSEMNACPDPLRTTIKPMLRDYVLFTICKDWPARREVTYLDGGDNRADAMRQRLAAFEPQTSGQVIIHAEVLCSFQRFVEARHERIASVFLQIPRVLRQAVVAGAVINVLLICLLQRRSRRQFVFGTVSALFLAVLLFVILSLDSPMRGRAGITPQPLLRVWDRSMTWDEPKY
ncbi:hypothetical protein [Paenirhodobacter sp.]|uniref:bestrophin-like domain n=1 Tax=Paenirhodobacter sp. TaxID=1965326 RepID=UPI003B51330B